MKQHALVILVLTCIGVFYVSTIRAGHNWGDDFAMYIAHARNIVEGRAYADTGYIYNPAFPSYSHDMYPPVFPLLLAPVYALFGLNLTAMKVELVLIFLGCLYLVFVSFRDELPLPYIVVLVAALGFMPFLWDFKDNVLSDIPFLFWTLASLLVIHRARLSSPGRRLWAGYGPLIGVSIDLAYGTRTIGFLLLPALGIYDLLKMRRLPPLVTVAATVFGLLALGQNIALHPRGSYFGLLSLDVTAYWRNLIAYPVEVRGLWDNGYSVALRNAAFLAVTTLSLVGYVLRLRSHVTSYEIFAALYTATMIFWPYYQGARYIIPLLPLYIFYVLVAVSALGRRLGQGWDLRLLATIALVIGTTYGAKYTTVNFGPLADGVETPSARDLFEWVRRTTSPADVFVAQKPRALALFTGRRASVFHRGTEDGQTWRFFDQIGARYVVVNLKGDRDGLLRFVERNPKQLSSVYSNADFRVYRRMLGGT